MVNKKNIQVVLGLLLFVGVTGVMGGTAFINYFFSIDFTDIDSAILVNDELQLSVNGLAFESMSFNFIDANDISNLTKEYLVIENGTNYDFTYATEEVTINAVTGTATGGYVQWQDILDTATNVNMSAICPTCNTTDIITLSGYVGGGANVLASAICRDMFDMDVNPTSVAWAWVINGNYFGTSGYYNVIKRSTSDLYSRYLLPYNYNQIYTSKGFECKVVAPTTEVITMTKSLFELKFRALESFETATYIVSDEKSMMLIFNSDYNTYSAYITINDGIDVNKFYFEDLAINPDSIDDILILENMVQDYAVQRIVVSDTDFFIEKDTQIISSFSLPVNEITIDMIGVESMSLITNNQPIDFNTDNIGGKVQFLSKGVFTAMKDYSQDNLNLFTYSRLGDFLSVEDNVSFDFNKQSHRFGNDISALYVPLDSGSVDVVNTNISVVVRDIDFISKVDLGFDNNSFYFSTDGVEYKDSSFGLLYQFAEIDIVSGHLISNEDFDLSQAELLSNTKVGTYLDSIVGVSSPLNVTGATTLFFNSYNQRYTQNIEPILTLNNVNDFDFGNDYFEMFGYMNNLVVNDAMIIELVYQNKSYAIVSNEIDFSVNNYFSLTSK